jgi:transcriptional regulator with XRE-family HTH domain
MMKPSLRLRLSREELELTPEEVASRIGIPAPSYYDLESTDDLEVCLGLEQVVALASLFNKPPSFLFAASEAEKVVPPEALAIAFAKMLTERKISIEKAEEEIGWTLAPLLHDASSAIGSWNMACLYDVCRAIGIDWRSVLDGLARS